MTATLSALDSRRARRTLRAVRLIHTVVWLFFVAVILAIPVAAWQRRFSLFLTLTALVLVEVAVLLWNGFSCPLTGVAARYTADRRDNFDIYLPLWLARYNKLIFGSLFVAGVVVGIVLALVPN
jgi:polyferredoxin